MAFGKGKDNALPKEDKKAETKEDKKAGKQKKKGKEARREKKPKKPGTPLKGALITFMVFILLFGAAYGAFTLNLFDARGLVADLLGVTDEASQRREAKLTEWETNLQRDAQILAEDQKNIKTAEQNIAGQEAAVEKKEDELAEKMAVYEDLNAQLQAKKNDINSVGKMLDSMSADAAAAILTEMKSKDNMLQTFSQLKPDTQAAILETLDAKAAAALIESLP